VLACPTSWSVPGHSSIPTPTKPRPCSAWLSPDAKKSTASCLSRAAGLTCTAPAASGPPAAASASSTHARLGACATCFAGIAPLTGACRAGRPHLSCRLAPVSLCCATSCAGPQEQEWGTPAVQGKPVAAVELHCTGGLSRARRTCHVRCAVWHALGIAWLPCALCSPELLLCNHLLWLASGILPSLWQHCHLT